MRTAKQQQSDPLALVRAAFADRRAWLVGGAVRDRALRGHAASGAAQPAAGAYRCGPRSGGADLDVVIDGDPGEAARALAHAAPRATAFALSEEYGGWRVVARGGAWQVDVEPLRGGSLEKDLALRDFTVNAIAESLGGPAGERGRLIDPLGGLEDLARGRLRVAGPRAFAEDPLRVLRLVRIAVELGLAPTPETLRQAAASAAELSSVSAERVFTELSRIVAARRAVCGLELMGEIGAAHAVLPELEATRGVQQSRYHHRDVYGHTLEVLEQTIALTAAWRGDEGDRVAVVETPPATDRLQNGPWAIDRAGVGGHRTELAALLAEPLADELTRGDALRWGALLHDLAKPLTREVRSDGRVTFIGHDHRGADLAQDVLGRLRASQRLRNHVAALVRYHLRAGFLVHEPQPLARRTVFRYLRTCEPVEVDVTLLSVADRLATRGERAQESIDAHLRLTEALVGDALRWRAGGGLRPLWRGDELARALGIPLGPRVGELLEELAEARYAGEVDTRAQALEHARRALAGSG